MPITEILEQNALKYGDDIALVGYPDAHARLDPSFRNGKEVFDRDLLDMRIVTEEIVVKNHNAVGRRLAQLKLTDHGCFLNRVIRSQIEMPIDDNVVLNKGDVLQVSGDARRVKTVADRIGFISIHSQVTDLLAFCAFFIVGLMIGMITFQFSNFSFGIGNAAGLTISPETNICQPTAPRLWPMPLPALKPTPAIKTIRPNSFTMFSAPCGM